MNVAVAIITDATQRILITRRSMLSTHGGFWEFPGGKLEQNESPSAALVREIKEEIGLDVIAYDYLGEVCYTYSSNDISLLIYHVVQYQGEPVCREAQTDLRWVDLPSLGNFEFPAANLAIINLFRKHLKSIGCET